MKPKNPYMGMKWTKKNIWVCEKHNQRGLTKPCADAINVGHVEMPLENTKPLGGRK